MNWLCFLGWAVGICGFVYGTRCWVELRRWSHLIKYGRIVVAYKNKVKLNAPLQEWALWCRNAEKQDSGTGPRYKSNGRILYQYGGTTIAVLNKSFVPDGPVKRLVSRLTKPEGKTVKAGTRAVDGTWSVQDETAKPTSNGSVKS